MTGAPQSTFPRICLPACLALLWAAVAPAPAPLAAQARTNATLSTDAEFQKEPSGTVLGRLVRGTALTIGPKQGGWVEVRFEGWIVSSALRPDRRDGFDVAVAVGAGTTVRTAPGGGTTLGTARAGALFKKLSTQGEWTQVERIAWIQIGAVAAEGKATTGAAAGAKPATGSDAVPAGIAVAGGATLVAQPAGAPIATLEVPLAATVLERREGWAKIRVEAWVREGSLGEAGRAGGPTAAEIRANPDRFVGETVEWSLQVLAVQLADELRPELPPGQPYVLARGPLPETGFVYLVVSKEEAAKFRAMEPLAKVMVRATIRAGRSRFLPTPVLTFVRRLN